MSTAIARTPPHRSGYVPIRKERQRDFGELLRTLREDRGFTLRRFAARMGISPTYLSAVERGEVPVPTEEKIFALAQVFERDPDELLAAAGRVASDLPPILNRLPREMAAFLGRVGPRVTPEDMQEITRFAEAHLADR
jgi:transcriptional regulator with XRE-family HTH domain